MRRDSGRGDGNQRNGGLQAGRLGGEATEQGGHHLGPQRLVPVGERDPQAGVLVRDDWARTTETGTHSPRWPHRSRWYQELGAKLVRRYPGGHRERRNHLSEEMLVNLGPLGQAAADHGVHAADAGGGPVWSLGG